MQSNSQGAFLCGLISVHLLRNAIYSFQAVISETAEKKKSTPHIYNLNFDPQLSGRIVHFIDGEKKAVGNGKGEGIDIVLVGPR